MRVTFEDSTPKDRARRRRSRFVAMRPSESRVGGVPRADVRGEVTRRALARLDDEDADDATANAIARVESRDDRRSRRSGSRAISSHRYLDSEDRERRRRTSARSAESGAAVRLRFGDARRRRRRVRCDRWIVDDPILCVRRRVRRVVSSSSIAQGAAALRGARDERRAKSTVGVDAGESATGEQQAQLRLCASHVEMPRARGRRSLRGPCARTQMQSYMRKVVRLTNWRARGRLWPASTSRVQRLGSSAAIPGSATRSSSQSSVDSRSDPARRAVADRRR